MNGAQAPVKDMRTAEHSVRRALHKKNPAARFYEFLAAIAIVGGICWGTYLVT